IPGAGGEGGRRSARVLPPALLVRPGPGARPGRRGHEGPRPAEAGRLPPRHRVQHGRRQGEVREERRVGEGTHPHGPVPEGPRHGHRSVPRAGQEGGALPRGAQVRRHRLPVRRGEELARALLFSWDLLANAVVAGLLLGGFYAAVSLGISLIFGLLDIANIAQPAFLILGSYAAYVMNEATASTRTSPGSCSPRCSNCPAPSSPACATPPPSPSRPSSSSARTRLT